MPQHRKNAQPHGGKLSVNTAAFEANKKRQRNRKEMAKASKRKNRK
jgi:hypothetical protein